MTKSWLQRARDKALLLIQKYEGRPLTEEFLLDVAAEAYLQGAYDQYEELEGSRLDDWAEEFTRIPGTADK